ncbi:MAG: hypothetical protein IPP69_07135 [Flavobacteriales bacterium]|nr:hypothetical protein [Flavobacteriales bacterium]
MKLRSYLIIFITAMAGTFFLASCLNEENKIPPNCYDGIFNNGENPELYVDRLTGQVMLDCGGPCEPCDHCANGVWEPGEDEDWVDCGGECGPCPQCANGVMDGDEVAIDCGGSCGGCELLCNDGLLNGYEDQIDCEDEDDTEQGGCDFCPTCIDGILNGQEKGIDCGGPDCPPCCSTGSCVNGLMDGMEFNTDCGGNTCYDCDSVLTWKIGGTSYYTPSIAIIKSQSPVPGPTVLEFIGCVAVEPDDEFLTPVGQLTLKITEPQPPAAGWPVTGTASISFPSTNATIADYEITFVDDMGVTYSTSNLDGEGVFVLTKVATLVIPNSTTDGCNKLPGTYYYYRGTFSGSLTTADAEPLSVSCSLGFFQVTFFVP